jgi:hypothetical protein
MCEEPDLSNLLRPRLVGEGEAFDQQVEVARKDRSRQVGRDRQLGFVRRKPRRTGTAGLAPLYVPHIRKL